MRAAAEKRTVALQERRRRKLLKAAVARMFLSYVIK